MEFEAISDRLRTCGNTVETLKHVIALRDIEIYLLKQEKSIGTVKSFQDTFSDIEEEFYKELDESNSTMFDSNSTMFDSNIVREFQDELDDIIDNA